MRRHATTDQIPSITGKLGRRLLVGVAAALGTLGVATVGPAAAWEPDDGFGSIGEVVPPTIYVGDIFQGGVKHFTLYGAVGPTVYRSPATTDIQFVQVRYAVERWNGAAWALLASSRILSSQIYEGQTGVEFKVAPYLMPSVTTGYFRVTYGIDWLDSAGTTLGSTLIVSNLGTDHVCGTVNPNRTCQNFDGYVHVG